MAKATSSPSSYRTKTNFNVAFTHYWTIESYAWYSGPGSAYNPGKFFESELFAIPPDVQKWLPANLASSRYKISISPKGDISAPKEENDYSSVYFHTTYDSPAQTLMVECAIVDADGAIQTPNECARKVLKEYEPGESWGFPKWMPNRVLLRPENRYLSPEGHLTLRFCVSFDVLTMKIEQNTKEELKVFGQAQLCANMTALWRMQSEYSDLVLEVSRGKAQVPAHKAILVAQSPVFAAMFRNKTCKESLESRICIPDMSVPVCDAFLEYLYTGNVKSLSEQAESLLPFADKYQIDYLKAICEDQLCAQITSKNGNRFLIFSEHHNATKLRDKSHNFIKKRAMESITTLLETPNKIAKVDRMLAILMNQ